MLMFKCLNFENIISQVRKYFNRADKNGDGKLTKEEWHQVGAFIIINIEIEL